MLTSPTHYFSPVSLFSFIILLCRFIICKSRFSYILAVILMLPRAYFFFVLILVSVSLFMAVTWMAPLLITSPRWSWRHVLSGSHFLVLRSIMFRFLAFSEYFSVLGSPIGCLHDIFPVYGRRSFLFTRGENL